MRKYLSRMGLGAGKKTPGDCPKGGATNQVPASNVESADSDTM